MAASLAPSMDAGPSAALPPSTFPTRVIRGPWADGPWLLFRTPAATTSVTHPAVHIANESVNLYNAMLRGINSLFLQAPFVTALVDIVDFLFLAQSWAGWVRQHRDHLKTRMYPCFEEVLGKPGALAVNLEETETFLPALEDLAGYSAQARDKPETYDAAKLLRIVEDLAPRLHHYFRAQVTVMMDMMTLCGRPGSPQAEARSVALLQSYQQLERELQTSADPFVVPPMMVRLRDSTFEGGNDWPKLSVLAVHQIADRLSPAHAGAWRFLPCTEWGKPRPLPFFDAGDIKGPEAALFPSPTGSSGSSILSLTK